MQITIGEEGITIYFLYTRFVPSSYQLGFNFVSSSIRIELDTKLNPS